MCIAIVGPTDELLYTSPSLQALLGAAAGELCVRSLRSWCAELPQDGHRASCALHTGNGADTQVEVVCWALSQAPADGNRMILFQPVAKPVVPIPQELQVLAGNMAHQLRNPIAAIGGALQVLRDRGGWLATESEIINEILRRLAEVNRGVDCLLDFARHFEPVRRPLELLSVAEAAAARLPRTTEVPPTDVTVVRHGAAVEVLGDADLLERALYHLVRNAAEAAPGAGVGVEVSAMGAQAAVDVVDVGPGCHAQVQQRMFEPFFTTKSRHFGIGLPVALRIAEAHGGSVRCLATGAAGTRMRLDVPRSDRA